jgi:hypothetical protein
MSAVGPGFNNDSHNQERKKLLTLQSFGGAIISIAESGTSLVDIEIFMPKSTEQSGLECTLD